MDFALIDQELHRVIAVLDYLFGQFFGLNKEFDAYSSNEAGLKLAFKVVCRMLVEFNIPALIMFIPNMLARLKGKKEGFNSIRNKKEENL